MASRVMLKKAAMGVTGAGVAVGGIVLAKLMLAPDRHANVRTPSSSQRFTG